MDLSSFYLRISFQNLSSIFEIRKEIKIYTFGEGRKGALGHGDQEDHILPKELVPWNGIPKTISCGESHTAIITTKGKLYIFGSGDWGQLGHNNQENQYYPKEVIFEPFSKSTEIIAISCGRAHTAALAKDHRLFTFGSGYFGQLGLGDFESRSRPKEIPFEISVIAISCGGFHTVIISERMQVYSFGYGENGQLGHNNKQNYPSPMMVENLYAVSVACGENHTAAIDLYGKLITFGSNNFGQLGHRTPKDVLAPEIVIAIQEEIISVFCGRNNTAIILSNGQSYLLKFDSLISLDHYCRRCKNFRSIAWGKDYMAIVDDNEELYTSGGHLGTGRGDEYSGNPDLHRIGEISYAKIVTCGYHHTVVLMERNIFFKI
jgi:alpha-tubulin suppressor-like RCC1 family protein